MIFLLNLNTVNMRNYEKAVRCTQENQMLLPFTPLFSLSSAMLCRLVCGFAFFIGPRVSHVAILIKGTGVTHVVYMPN